MNKPRCLNCNLGRGLSVCNGYCKKCWRRADPITHLKGRVRCVVAKCENHTDQGTFVGQLCAPCHTFVSMGLAGNSQAQRNAVDFVARRLGGVVAAFLERQLAFTVKGQPMISDKELLELMKGR